MLLVITQVYYLTSKKKILTELSFNMKLFLLTSVPGDVKNHQFLQFFNIPFLFFLSLTLIGNLGSWHNGPQPGKVF